MVRMSDMPTYADLEFALETASTHPRGLVRAVYDRAADTIYYDYVDLGENEIPEDLDWDQCLEIPHKHDLDLGKRLVFDFVEEVISEEADAVHRIFSRRGAYGQFKDFLFRMGRLDEWFAYEHAAVRRAILRWCEENGVKVTGVPDGPAGAEKAPALEKETLRLSIHPCRTPDEPGWLDLREALWPGCPRDQQKREMAEWCFDPDGCVALLARTGAREVIGLAEASVRHDHVNGTETSPVGFLEGLYVAPRFRRQGVARRLVEAVEAWAKAAGCRELASDADLRDRESHRMHRALGFEETERVVFFRKGLA